MALVLMIYFKDIYLHLLQNKFLQLISITLDDSFLGRPRVSGNLVVL